MHNKQNKNEPSLFVELPVIQQEQAKQGCGLVAIIRKGKISIKTLEYVPTDFIVKLLKTA